MLSTLASYAQESQNGGTSFFELVWAVATIVGMWKMFEKAGEPGWPALIPFYDSYKLCEICMGNPWYWLRLFVVVVPIVGWIAAIYFAYQMYKAVALSFGKPESWSWGLLFLSPVFMCMLGFGDAEYYGPNGEDDRRTRQARQSKTVNFDVVKDDPVVEPVREYQDYSAQTRVNAAPESKEEDVDFTFDQPVE